MNIDIEELIRILEIQYWWMDEKQKQIAIFHDLQEYYLKIGNN